MTKEQLLEKANADYPKGTVYHCAVSNVQARISLPLNMYTPSEVSNSTQITDGCGGAVYYNGQWAEIISKPKNEK